MPRVVRGLRISPRVSRDSRLLRGGFELVLLRRAEGPAVHEGSKQQAPPLRADGSLENHWCVGAAAFSHACVHGGRSLEISAARFWRTSERPHRVVSRRSRTAHGACARKIEYV